MVEADIVVLDLLTEALARMGQLYRPAEGQTCATGALADAPPHLVALVGKLSPLARRDPAPATPPVRAARPRERSATPMAFGLRRTKVVAVPVEPACDAAEVPKMGSLRAEAVCAPCGQEAAAEQLPAVGAERGDVCLGEGPGGESEVDVPFAPGAASSSDGPKLPSTVHEAVLCIEAHLLRQGRQAPPEGAELLFLPSDVKEEVVTDVCESLEPLFVSVGELGVVHNLLSLAYDVIKRRNSDCKVS